MTRFLVALSAVAVVLAVANAAPVPKDANEPPLYFPTRVGAKLVYQWGDSEQTEVVTGVTWKPGRTAVVKYSRKFEARKAITFIIAVSGDGVFGPWDAEPADRVYDLKLPHKDGATWSYPSKTGDMAPSVTGTQYGPERVTVPAGTFTAIRIEEVMTSSESIVSTTSWYAPDLGLVKRLPQGQPEMVLKSYTTGKD